ncbi:peptidyl-prolyl cis-trans isomerase FKBP8 [Trichonephila clavipes]|nr:peptidyl-prolyl cis-trans isomerase FKBP8 [Trichonephila clavipes]
MDDNATCHRTLAVQDCLDSKGIQRLVWPARSPDLNPIENVYDVLGRKVAGRNYPPTNKNTLIRALTEEWDKLPQQLLDNVVQSMCSGMSTEESQAILDMRIKVHNNMAAAHLKLSAYSAGLHSVELVLKVQPKNVKALFRKAMILGAQGLTEEAIVCLRFAASLEPDTKLLFSVLMQYIVITYIMATDESN